MNIRLLVLLILAAVAMPMRAAEGPLDLILPGGDVAPAQARDGDLPAFMRSGVRITFESTQGSTEGGVLESNPKGDIKGTDGRRYSRGFVGGGGGHGFSQLDVTHATREQVIADMQFYVFAQPNVLKYGFNRAVVGDETGLGRYWIHPATLRKLKDGEDFRVLRRKHTHGGHEFDAVFLKFIVRGVLCLRWYDTRSGLLLEGGAIMKDPNYRIDFDDGTTETIEGGAFRETDKLVSVRQIDLPWLDSGHPRWLKPDLTLRFRGTYTDVVGHQFGVQIPPRAMTLEIAIQEIVGAVALADFVQQVEDRTNVAPHEFRNTRAYGPATHNALWINPHALKDVQAGEVLDEDPIIRSRLIYTGTADGVVGLTLTTPLEKREMDYDAANGNLVWARVVFKNLDGSDATVVEYRLADD